MKRLTVICLSILLIFAFAVGSSAVDVDPALTGDKVVITYGDWVYEKVNDYGYEIDRYIGAGPSADLPATFAKQYVNSIGDYAFSGVTTLTSVNLTPFLNYVEEYAFNNCPALETVTFYSSTTSLGLACFYGDAALQNVNLQDSSIGEVPAYCFAECGISSIALPDICEKIGNYAFYNCGSLSNLKIPASVTEISDTAFVGCDDLVIIAPEGSYAIDYAVAHNIEYVEKPASYLLGDADNNGAVEIIDATFIQRYEAKIIVPFHEEILMQGDVDRNDSLESTDACFIMRHIIGMQTPYPIGETVTA